MPDATPPESYSPRGTSSLQEKGGHFAASEVPELFANDLREAFNELAGY